MKTIFAVALFLSFGATSSVSFANSIEDYIATQVEEQREQETRDFIESTMDDYRDSADDRYQR